MTNDLLADALNTIKTSENVGRESCTIKSSKLIEEVLNIFIQQGYIKEYSQIKGKGSGFLKVFLFGRINECGVIKPRFPVRKAEWAQWEQRYIPGVNFGILIVSTSRGLMTNEDAKSQGIGGRLISYIF